MDLHEHTWTDADATTTDLAFLPVGSTEQHGPHAPMGTDYLAAATVARKTAAALEQEIMVAPPVPVGISEEHRQFTGTLWVSPDTFRDYVREIADSLIQHGWNRIVLVNGHGGNIPALGEVAADLSRTEEALVVPFTWFDAVDGTFEMGHAGPLETSLLLHTDPELVEDNRLETARDGGADQWGDWVAGTNLAHDSAEFTENGTVGDPTEASGAEGVELLREAINQLDELVVAIAQRSVDRPDHK